MVSRRTAAQTVSTLCRKAGMSRPEQWSLRGSVSRSDSRRVAETVRGCPVALPEVGGLPVALDVPSAGHLLGIGRTRAYQLAATGRFPCPVLRIGGSWRVPTVPLLELLGLPVPERYDL